MRITVMKKTDGSHRIFLRYAINNLQILVLPLLISFIYYGVSIRVVQENVDSVISKQLEQSVRIIDLEIIEIDKMMIQLSNDYEINYYMSNYGPLTDIEYYNLTQLTEKIAPYVFGNPIMSHLLLYLHKSEIILSESGSGSYEDFYGNLFGVKGYSASEWRDRFLRSSAMDEFHYSQNISMMGESSRVHFYTHRIGFGDNPLGSLVAVIDDTELKETLADLPQKYRGWVYVQDRNGQFITSIGLVNDQNLPSVDLLGQTDLLEINGERYRLYSRKSSLNGWIYTAAVNEAEVFGDVKAVRDTAFLLFGSALFLGLIFSGLVAYRSSRPWRGIFEAVQSDELRTSRRNIYNELESAVTVITSRNRQLTTEVKSAQKITRDYFFQNLLRGNYRNREEFDRDRKLFDIVFVSDFYYVIICRVASLHAVRDDNIFSRLRESLISAINSVVSGADYHVPISFDDVAIIRSIDSPDAVKEDAFRLVSGLQSAISVELRSEFAFGVGTPLRDPFLLSISCNQAVSAGVSAEDSSRREPIFYDEDTYSSESYVYSLDTEQNLMQSIRVGNYEVVTSLVAEIRSENFERRQLAREEGENLFVELKGTILKLFSTIPELMKDCDESFNAWCALPVGTEKLIGFEALCFELSKHFDSRKKSHNSALLEAIQAYLVQHFNEPALSLTELAENLKRTENYLSSFYKDQTGVRLSEAILKLRMEYAEELITRGFESIDHIAEQSGYANTSSFRRSFKRYFGVSPSVYRSKSQS